MPAATRPRRASACRCDRNCGGVHVRPATSANNSSASAALSSRSARPARTAAPARLTHGRPAPTPTTVSPIHRPNRCPASSSRGWRPTTRATWRIAAPARTVSWVATASSNTVETNQVRARLGQRHIGFGGCSHVSVFTSVRRWPGTGGADRCGADHGDRPGRAGGPAPPTDSVGGDTQGSADRGSRRASAAASTIRARKTARCSPLARRPRASSSRRRCPSHRTIDRQSTQA